MADAEGSVVEELVGNAHGNLARVRELLDVHPAALNLKAPWNETAIEAATQMGDKPIIELLIGRGAPVDFFTACVLGRMDEVKAELEADPERVNARGVHDLPALYFAAIGGSAAMVRLLLEHGADPSLPDYKGRGARQLAEDMGRPALAALFD